MKKLLFFHVPWCPPCRLYEREVITPLEQIIGSDRVVRVNAQEKPFTAEKYDIDKLPTIVILDGGGWIMQSTGGYTVDRLIEIMED